MSEVTKSRTPMIIGALVAVVIVAVVIGVVASSSNSKKNASATTTSSTSTIPNNFKYNARQDVSQGACVHQGKLWVLSGGLVNSAKVTRNYQIIVDYVTPSGGTVIGSTTLEIPKVKAGQQKTWKISGAKGATSVNCVIRNVRAIATP